MILLCVADTSAGFANFDAFASDNVGGPVSLPAGAGAVNTVGGPVSLPAGAGAVNTVGGPGSVNAPAPPVSADKYSALAELESAFSVPAVVPNPAMNWDSLTNRNAVSSWGTSTTVPSVFGSVPMPSGVMYGGNVATPAARFTAAAGNLTLISISVGVVSLSAALDVVMTT